MAYVELKDVYKRYKMGDTVINANNGINFSFEKGELVVIVGPSGAGKSTVLNILGGMDTADEGEIIIDGKHIEKFNNRELTNYRRDDIGFVFQFYNLINNLTARENVELASEIVRDAIPADEVLESVGLKDRMDNFPSQLSGGEQQRVAIARALAKKPKLLLCDEPTGALDYHTGRAILELLQKTLKEYDTTLVVITHNSAITPIANRIIEINDSVVRDIRINDNPKSISEIEW
ncbi:MAG: ABC transporter ATP-binding protein [Tissierellia bacterium]|nr:ABC transporter ATP-binding protein [Tissierellia bacterium]